MTELKENLKQMLEKIEQERQELRVQLHLAGMEGKEKWEALEERFHRFGIKAQPIIDEAGEVSEDVVAALRLVGDEIKQGYKALRSKL